MASLKRRASLLRSLRPIAALAMAVCTGATTAAPLEQAVKAGYVAKFAPFVEWPQASFAAPDSPLTICLAGRDPFGSTIDELVRGQRVRGRPVKVRRAADMPSVDGCHILVIGAGTPDAILDQASGKPLLTVSDKTAGVDGGMIHFVRTAGRIRFEIDNGAARAAHLAISSKLLGLAVVVKR